MADDKNCYIGVRAYGSPNVDHMTVLWMGKELPPITIMAILKKYKDHKLFVDRKSIEAFGHNLIAAVLKMDDPENNWIQVMRGELLLAGAKDHSQYNWRPHITIRTMMDETQPAAITIPVSFTLAEPYISINGNRIYA